MDFGPALTTCLSLLYAPPSPPSPPSPAGGGDPGYSVSRDR